jgi:aminodeoxyfutalosine deaminase
MRQLYTADVVYSGVGLPLEDGAVLVSSDAPTAHSSHPPSNPHHGTIIGFGKLEALARQFPEVPSKRLGRAILPPPVNAHTHLDLSDVPFKALPYPRWIPEHILQNQHLRGLEAAKRGLALLEQTHIGAFGDIVAREPVMDFLLSQTKLHGVAYWEVLNPNPSAADDTIETTRQKIKVWRKLERTMRLGLSPHTPFTVSHTLWRRLFELVKLEALPLQIHVAEHPSELELFCTGTGTLAQSLAKNGLPPFEVLTGRKPDKDLSPIKYLAELRILELKPTLVHAVNVSEEDIKIIAQYGCTVVCCPRSNQHLECGSLPWQLYAKHGVEVALGTDSSASGESLDIRQETSAALQLLDIDLKMLLRWMVKGGYRALGAKPPVVQRGDPFSSLVIWQ